MNVISDFGPNSILHIKQNVTKYKNNLHEEDSKIRVEVVIPHSIVIFLSNRGGTLIFDLNFHKILNETCLMHAHSKRLF